MTFRRPGDLTVVGTGILRSGLVNPEVVPRLRGFGRRLLPLGGSGIWTVEAE